MNRISLFLLIGFFAFSCSRIKQETTRTICPTDTSTYSFISYYPNGNYKKTGAFRNMKRIHTWISWYTDGTIRWRLEYAEENIILLDEDREFPVLKFENDTLQVGKTVKFKAIGLLPFEELESSENVILERLPDDPEFDYEVTPIKDGQAYFYYMRKTRVEDTNYKLIVSEYKITEEETKKLPVKMYKETTYELASKAIYYPAEDSVK